MSPSPTSYASPAEPASYAWEATDEAVAARYGVPIERVVRFDLNTPPESPPFVLPMLAAGRFQTSLSDYPPGDYRELTEAVSVAYGVATDEIVVAAGADEVLDIAVKALLPPGGTAVLPVPTYAMYRVLTEQRPARVVTVDRRSADGGCLLDLEATRAAAAGSDLVWLCSPNNPTGLAEPDGAIEGLLEGLEADARRAGTPPPAVVLDEAYAEFAGRDLLAMRARYPRLVLVRTMSKAYGLAGFRVGFGVASAGTIERLARFRPPGSVTTVSATIATEALRRPEVMRATVASIVSERDRLAAQLRSVGWRVAPSATNFLLVGFGTAESAAGVAQAMLSRGLVPRTFGAGHPLSDHLRITVRRREDDDRLIELAGDAVAMEAR